MARASLDLGVIKLTGTGTGIALIIVGLASIITPFVLSYSIPNFPLIITLILVLFGILCLIAGFIITLIFVAVWLIKRF